MKKVTPKEKEAIYKAYNKFIVFKNEKEEITVKTKLQEFMNFINF